MSESETSNETLRTVSFGDVFPFKNGSSPCDMLIIDTSESGNTVAAAQIAVIEGIECLLGIGATMRPKDITQIIGHWETARALRALENGWRRASRVFFATHPEEMERLLESHRMAATLPPKRIPME